MSVFRKIERVSDFAAKGFIGYASYMLAMIAFDVKPSIEIVALSFAVAFLFFLPVSILARYMDDKHKGPSA